MPADNTPTVSVLVPVYNTERYLSQCMDALCSQSLHDLEIIAINDGSTDSSLEILKGYAERDTRIRIIDKPNSGYGASLNRGILEARGTYIGISEPDDYPSRSLFKRLSDAAERHHCDLVKCNYYEHFEDHETVCHNLQGHPYGKVFDPADRPSIIRTVPAIWTALYRREWLLNEGIWFRETPGASFQDAAFVMKAWFAAKRCLLIRKPLLHYRMDNPGSSSRTTDKVFVVCDELAESLDFLRRYPERYPLFVPWFHYDKWSKYRWNYERIDSSCHAQFMQRVFDEFTDAMRCGELDIGIFDDISLLQLDELLQKGPLGFASDHPLTY